MTWKEHSVIKEIKRNTFNVISFYNEVWIKYSREASASEFYLFWLNMQIQICLNAIEKYLLKDVDLKIKLNRHRAPLSSETDFPDVNGIWSKKIITRLIDISKDVCVTCLSCTLKAVQTLSLLPSFWWERVRDESIAVIGLMPLQNA